MTYILKNETKQIGQWDGYIFNRKSMNDPFFILNDENGSFITKRIKPLTTWIKVAIFARGVLNYKIPSTGVVQNIGGTDINMPIDTGELYDSLLEFLDDNYERLSDNEWEVPDLEQLEDDMDEFYYLMKQNYDFIDYDILNHRLRSRYFRDAEIIDVKNFLKSMGKLEESRALMTKSALQKLIKENLLFIESTNK